MGIAVAERRLFSRDKLKVEIYSTREEAAMAAANAAAAELKRLSKEPRPVSVIFATGASQLLTLRALTGIPDLPWRRVEGFHMDEYVGISPEHQASFRRYLKTELTEKVAMYKFHEIDGNASSTDQECSNYAEALLWRNPQLCLVGIGENGHLAFNAPGVANFEDPLDVKVVDLDDDCKRQQVAEGWFDNLDEVPDQAVTLTIPVLLRVPKLIVSVPGLRKAVIVKRTLREAISTACPSTVLRNHPDATLYLDAESSAELYEHDCR